MDVALGTAAVAASVRAFEERVGTRWWHPAARGMPVRDARG
jgi:hypothetical protein